MQSKVLIVTPSFKIIGGVANHYLGLKDYWKYNVKYEFYGKRKNIPAVFTFGFDLIKYFLKLIFNRPSVVIINPSFRKYQLIRDGIYLSIARLFKIPVITFFHGWNFDLSDKVKKKPTLFKYIFNKSLFIYVLYSKFKLELELIGIDIPINITTTKVNDQYLTNVNIDKKNGKISNILFLSRIEKNKGIYEALDAFNILSLTNKNIFLTVVGDGGELKNAKSYSIDKKIPRVKFKGILSGQELINEFIDSDIYLFPSYSEGMPTSVLEAMAFGLPIISRPVGGLNDFFIDGEMGYLINSLEPEKFAEVIQKLIENPTLTKEISLFNFNYSKRFLASRVALSMESDIKSMLKNIN